MNLNKHQDFSPLETKEEYLARTLPQLKPDSLETMAEFKIRLIQEREAKTLESK